MAEEQLLEAMGELAPLPKASPFPCAFFFPRFMLDPAISAPFNPITSFPCCFFSRSRFCFPSRTTLVLVVLCSSSSLVPGDVVSGDLVGKSSGGGAMGTPYHLQSPRTIINKVISMKQQPPGGLPVSGVPPALSVSASASKMILQPRHRTTPAMWCAAIFCFAFSVLLILTGVVILIVYLAVKPRTPLFDVASASLNAVYVGSPAPPSFNGDMTLVANVSNPNQRIDVVFQSAAVELFFRGKLVAAQALPPFAQRRGQSRILNVRMVSSQVVLLPEAASELQSQMSSNRILYTMRATFKVWARFWSWHYTYRMISICDLELTAPPSGVLVGRRCKTKS